MSLLLAIYLCLSFVAIIQRLIYLDFFKYFKQNQKKIYKMHKMAENWQILRWNLFGRVYLWYEGYLHKNLFL